VENLTGCANLSRFLKS
jgi:nucleoid DNA-binding protein